MKWDPTTHYTSSAAAGVFMGYNACMFQKGVSTRAEDPAYVDQALLSTLHTYPPHSVLLPCSYCTSENEAQRGQVTCSRLHSKEGVEARWEPRQSGA